MFPSESGFGTCRHRLSPGVDLVFDPAGPADTTQVARAALFASELGRANGAEDGISLWREAVAACAAAGLGWDQVSSWRLASVLMQSGGPVKRLSY